MNLNFQPSFFSAIFVQQELSEAVSTTNSSAASASTTALLQSTQFEAITPSSAASQPLCVLTTTQSQLYTFYRTERRLERKEKIARTRRVRNESVPDTDSVPSEDMNTTLSAVNAQGSVKKKSPKSKKKSRKRNRDIEEDSYSDSDYIDDDTVHDFGPCSHSTSASGANSDSDSGSDDGVESNSVASSHLENTIGGKGNKDKNKNVNKTSDNDIEGAAPKDSDSEELQKSKKKKKKHLCTHPNCDRVFSTVRAYKYRWSTCISLCVISIHHRF